MVVEAFHPGLMRIVHALVDGDERDRVFDVLSEENVDYVVTEEASGRDEAVVVHFPVPSQAVDPLLDQLREAGLGDSFVVIANAETASTPHFEELEERFVEGERPTTPSRARRFARRPST